MALAPLQDTGLVSRAWDAQTKDLAPDHALVELAPCCGDCVHLLADPARFGKVGGIGRRCFGF